MSNTTTPGALAGRISRSGIAGLAIAAGVLVGVHSGASATAPQVTVHTATPTGLSSDGITVTGTAQVLGTPDLLTVAMSIETHAAHVSDALSDANTRAQGLISAFSSAGVGAADIQTQSASISQNYTSAGTVDGYSVTESLQVKLHDLSRAGAVLDAAARTGGDSVRLNGMQLSISDDSAYLAAARKAAMVDARTKAQQFAEAGGSKLGQLRSVTAVSGDNTSPIALTSPKMATASGAVPVSPGQQDVDVTVTTAWDLTS